MQDGCEIVGGEFVIAGATRRKSFKRQNLRSMALRPPPQGQLKADDVIGFERLCVVRHRPTAGNRLFA
jgi:hypothetical protein